MKILIALLIIPPSFAISITSALGADAISHSSARVYWTTDVPSSTYIKYGLTSQYDKTALGGPSTNGQTLHAWFLSGLAPQTVYHFAGCSSDGTTEACSADQTFTTLAYAVGNHPADPELPRATVDTSMPVQTGNVLTVGPDCDDPSTGLLALWGQANWGDTVVIPVTTVCSGSYHFPAKAADTNVPHRWIITRTGAADADLPPPGTRVTPDNAASLATIRANVLNTQVLPISYMAAGCSAGSYFWVQYETAWPLYQCVNDQPRMITGASGNTITPMRITIPNHGLAVGDHLWITGMHGNTAANGTMYVRDVIDANTITLQNWSYGDVVGNGDWTGGGSVQKNVWALTPHTEGTAIPDSCTTGDWFYKTDAGPGEYGVAHDGAYRCVNGVFVHWLMRNVTDFPQYPAINLSDNSAHHLRFIGLHLATQPVPPEPLWEQADGSQTGSMYLSLVYQDVPNHHIIWDRCWFEGPDEPARIRQGGHFEGSYIAVIDSFFNKLQWWMGSQTGQWVDWETAGIVIDKGPGPGLFHNNYIEAYGISLYASDDDNSNTPVPSDYEISGNYFYRSDVYKYGSVVSNGRTYFVRHHLEMKRGVRWLVDGNVFDGNWASVNNAAAIALSPRPGPGALVQSITNGLVTTYYPHYLQPGNRIVIYYTANANLNNTVWNVDSVIDATHFHLGGNQQSSTGGYANLQNNVATVSDIMISNNTIRRVNSGVFTLGHTDGGGYPFIQNPVFARLKIYNNLFTGIDSSRGIPNGSFPNGTGGTVFYSAWGAEDMQFIHNTVAGNAPNTIPIAFDTVAATNPCEGFLATDNILFYDGGAIVSAGTYFGTTALNNAWTAGANPSWTFQKNVIAKSGPPPLIPPFGPYPPANSWFDLAGGPFPFVDPSRGNFQLRSNYTASSTCFGTAGDCSTDGTDVGVNLTTLETAQGLIGTLASRSSHAVVKYTAPDSRACSVDYGSDPSLKLKIRKSDGGGTPNRSVKLDELNPEMRYYYRVGCPMNTAAVRNFAAK